MKEMAVRDALREAIAEEMERDDDVFIMGEDITEHGGIYGVTDGLVDKFGPERVRITPISEVAIIGSALGAAITGSRPIAELEYIDFATVAMDQIVNQTAKIRYMFGGKVDVPLVIRAQGGGGRGSAAQHSQSLEAWFMHVPGLKVVKPSTPYDAKGLLKTAIREDNPVMFVEQKMAYNFTGEVPEEEYTVPFGKAEVRKEGKDVTVVANAYLLPRAEKAAAEMAKEGVSVEIVDPLSLVPFDNETIEKSVAKTGKLVVVHEAVKRCGFGAEIASKIMENDDVFYYLDAPLRRVAGAEVPVPYNERLENYGMPEKDDIKEAIKEVCHL